MLCPRCNRALRPALEDTPSGRIEVDYCPGCRGIWFDRGELEALLSRVQSSSFSLHLGNLAASTTEPTEGQRRCPRHPVQRMVQRELTPQAAGRMIFTRGEPVVRIDQCPDCLGLWLDGGELHEIAAALTRGPAHPLLRPPVPPSVVAAGRPREEDSVPETAPPPTSAWLWLFMFLTGLPVEHDHPRRRWPLTVSVLIVLCVLAFFYTLGSPNPDRFIWTFGLVPERSLMGHWLPIFSHMFLHGSFMHLFGNMYFLWVFGDNVEDRLGRSRFLLLYCLSGLGAATLQLALTPDPSIPMVGASGAISGVMAAYALLFPKARLVSLIFIFRVHWKTSTYLLIWLAFQLFGAFRDVPKVAWWAHIGGFIVGGALAWHWRPTQPTAPQWPPIQTSPQSKPKLEWT